MEKQRVSVVMATYNGEKFIKKQLESIYGQSQKPDEIIILDDCSSDNTFELLKQLTENRENTTLLRNEQNMGYIHTFYELLERANGDIVFLADQDDIWFLDKIENMCRVMEGDDHILSLNSSFVKIDEHDKIVDKNEHIRRESVKKISIKNVTAYNVSMGCTLAIRRKIIDIVKDYKNKLTKLSIPHDWAINMIAARYNGLYKYNKETIMYRLHEKNTIGLKRAGTISERIADYNNTITIKRDMYQLGEYMGFEYELLSYIQGMIESYYARIEALEKKSVIRYLTMCFKNRIGKYCRITTVLYDFRLLLIDKTKSEK